MGFKYLNTFLRDHCTTQSVSKKSIKICTGKTIVVDTSIYLYKFKGDNALLKNMHRMIALFNKHEIRPIFIFDGKPPIEKQQLMMKRYEDKKQAREMYWKMVDSSCHDVETMKELKKKSLRITANDILSVKELLTSYDATFYDAPGESDQLCAYLVNSEQAWACLSDDMDMLVYGCARVIRHISLSQETVIFNDMSKIVKELHVSILEFRQIVILSGTDYCDVTINKPMHLEHAYRLFHEYTENPSGSFFEWLVKKQIIKDAKEADKICVMFDISHVFDLLGKEIESQETMIMWKKLKPMVPLLF